MNEEPRVRRSIDAEKQEKDMEAFRIVAPEGAPTPAFPGVVLRVRELWLRNRETITREGASPADWNAAVMRDTVSLINQDDELTWLGLPDMDAEAVASTLETYFSISIK